MESSKASKLSSDVEAKLARARSEMPHVHCEVDLTFTQFRLNMQGM